MPKAPTQMKRQPNSDLPDVNVWLALSDTRHAQHAAAREYWDRQRATHLVFCRVTMLGLLRISTNAKAMLGQSFSNAEAWAIYQTYLGLPDCELRPDPPRQDTTFATLTLDASLPHRLWTDAYLAAFAIAGGCRLVSFDTDFQRFHGLELLLLEG
jgi:toxin-antitoxin system PIN domain toxin